MKRIINFRPFLIMAIYYVIGMIVAERIAVGKTTVGIVLAVITAVTIVPVLRCCGKIKKRWLFVLITAVTFLAGQMVLGAVVKAYDDADLGNMIYAVKGRIVSVENDTEYGKEYIVGDVELDGVKKGGTKYKIRLYINGDSEYDIGDEIEFKALLRDKGAVYEGALNCYEISDGIKYTATIEQGLVNKTGRRRSIFETVNVGIRETLSKGLDKDEFSVAYGMMCGNTEYMNDEALSSFREAGVAHIFAVSGLHVGFMASILAFVLNKMKVGKRVSAVVTVTVLFAYSGVCGFTASSLRAAIMSAVLLISNVKGKKYDGLSSISIACIIVLTISPAQLFCAGFQLSFVVVAGIFLLYKVFEKIFSFLPNKLSSSLATAFAAQIASIPISLAHFGSFSLVSVFINVLFIPLASVLFVILFVCCAVGGIFGIAEITLFVPNYMLKGLNYVMLMFDYKIFTVGGFSFYAFALLYYATLPIIGGKINLTRTVSVILTCVTVVTCGVCTVSYNFAVKNQTEIYVIGDKTVCATVITSGDLCGAVISGAEKGFSVARLKRRIAKIDGEKLDFIIIPKCAGGLDSQNVVTKMNTVTEIKRVYFYGEETEEKVLKASFPSIDVTRCVTETDIIEGSLKMKITGNGYAVTLSKGEFNTVMLSTFGTDNGGYARLNVYGVDLIIADDYAESVYSVYKPKKLVSYRKYGNFDNGQSSGDFCLVLD